MKTRYLGRSGLQVSVVGVGCNNFGGRMDLEASRKVIDKALDLGITLFDCAESYGNYGGSEKILGEVLGARRQDAVIVTKFGHAMDSSGVARGGSRRYVMSAVEASLKRLKTDYIDLYYLHKYDPKTPIEETLRAMDDLVRQGKVRYIGCSNLPTWRVVEAVWTSRQHNLHTFISSQNLYNLLERDIEQELIPAMETYGLGLLPYTPLASGLLTGKYDPKAAPAKGTRLGNNNAMADRWMTEKNWTKVTALQKFAADRGHSMVELAFSWLVCRPVVSSVIAGASTPAQLEVNAKAADWVLTREEMAEIDRITAGK